MTGAVPTAFYAPLKSPRHPKPSGDRTMARLVVRALEEAGFAPVLASELRSLDLAGDPALQARIRAEAEAEADRLVARFRRMLATERPRLWFTYHVYYKAPDWIGPRVADALGIPYAVAEASRARKRAHGPWRIGHSGSEAALDRADCVFVMTAADGLALEAAKPRHQRLVDFPPFLDPDEWGAGRRTGAPAPDGVSRLLTVAMMRRGDKLASYALLARALTSLADRSWALDIVGDGEARPEAERLFAGFPPGRVRFHGAIEDRARLGELYAKADLFAWPAVNEAYGMAFLEAQLFGCPVLAGAGVGVAAVVVDGVTGHLTPPGDEPAFARVLGDLLDAPASRQAMGLAARRFVLRGRTLPQAAARLREGLAPLVAGRSAA